MSCLFNSLSYFIHLPSFEIRQKICDYLTENKPIIEGIETREILELEGGFDRYIRDMRSMHTWGGAIEIQVACNIWNTKIHVKCLRANENSIIEFIPIVGTAETEYTLEWTGGHYEPMR